MNTVTKVNTFLSELNDSGRSDRAQDISTVRSQVRGYWKCCMNIICSEDKENREPGKITVPTYLCGKSVPTEFCGNSVPTKLCGNSVPTETLRSAKESSLELV